MSPHRYHWPWSVVCHCVCCGGGGPQETREEEGRLRREALLLQGPVRSWCDSHQEGGCWAWPCVCARVLLGTHQCTQQTGYRSLVGGKAACAWAQWPSSSAGRWLQSASPVLRLAGAAGQGALSRPVWGLWGQGLHQPSWQGPGILGSGLHFTGDQAKASWVATRGHKPGRGILGK